MTTYHWHHLVPVHAGGTDDPDNLVRVTIEQHAELHLARYLEHGHAYDWIASQCLSGQITNAEANQEARRHYMTNRVVTEETRRKMSEGQRRRTEYPRGDVHWDCSGENNPFYGKTHDAETREKCRAGAHKQWERKLIWVNNGVKTKRVVEGEIPAGYVRGRGRRTK